MARECLESLMLGIRQRVQSMLCVYSHIFFVYLSNIYYASLKGDIYPLKTLGNTEVGGWGGGLVAEAL